MIGHYCGIVRLHEDVHGPHTHSGRLRGRRVVEQHVSITAIHLVAVVRDDCHGFGIIVRLDEGIHRQADRQTQRKDGNGAACVITTMHLVAVVRNDK